ncbi:hypothetical protein H6P81_021174 [Aristolochia fimbriata]|uniref:Uncharacterized protein n=1 Tax=Aristolochia fimbriata TaxID=158543 RepID=A0AAV7DRM9_ARIFI|nr:hypothetical protein H6P81_021174 [Aristolochia fimbriata]
MAFDAADSIASSFPTALAPANANAAGNPLPLPASSRRVRGDSRAAYSVLGDRLDYSISCRRKGADSTIIPSLASRSIPNSAKLVAFVQSALLAFTLKASSRKAAPETSAIRFILECPKIGIGDRPYLIPLRKPPSQSEPRSDSQANRYSRTSPSRDECAAESIAVDSLASIPVAFLRPYSSTLPKTGNSLRPLTGNPGMSLKS